MSILDTVLSTGGGALVNQLATRFGINAEQATSAVSAMVPMIAGGMKEKIANNDPGITDLLTSGKLTQFAGELPNLGTPAAADAGNSLLSQIFSSGQTSNIVSTIAEKVGIGSDTVSKLLPIVATLVGGFVSKSAASGGNLADTVGQLADVGQGGILGAVKSLASKMLG